MHRRPATAAQPPQTGSTPPVLGDVLAANCPSRQILLHISSRWGGLVLIGLGRDTLRFSALRRRIGGISERMLAETLRLLEEDGLVHRHAHDVVPPHVDYRLTDLGQDLAQRYLDLATWIEVNLARFPPRGAA